MLQVASGGIARLAGSVGGALVGLTERITATPGPSVPPAEPSDAPTLVAPPTPYTNQPTVDLVGTVPADLAGRDGYRIRIYVAHGDERPVPIREIPLPPTLSFRVAAVELAVGRNDFIATIVGPGGESEPSAPIVYALDVTPPPIEIGEPEGGATVNRPTATITGTTQGRSTVNARNEANGATATATADAEGRFELTLPIEPGPNGIRVTATDRAGNTSSVVLTVNRGEGKLTARLNASSYRYSASKLPHDIVLTATVTDPDGHPLEGANVLFTLSVPGLPVVTSEATTDGTGQATFRTTIGTGATVGSGNATALVTTAEFGTARAVTAITIVE